MSHALAELLLDELALEHELALVDLIVAAQLLGHAVDVHLETGCERPAGASRAKPAGSFGAHTLRQERQHGEVETVAPGAHVRSEHALADEAGRLGRPEHRLVVRLGEQLHPLDPARLE